MKEDIKKIEEFIDEIKGCGVYDCCTNKTESCKPIENLIERYKQLEEEKKKFNPEIWYNEGWDRADEYWKSKVKEKIEELEKMELQCDTFCSMRDYAKLILQELLREEKINVL